MVASSPDRLPIPTRPPGIGQGSFNRCVFRCRFAPACGKKFGCWQSLKIHLREAHPQRHSRRQVDDPHDLAVVKAYHDCAICNKPLIFDTKFIYIHITVSIDSGRSKVQAVVSVSDKARHDHVGVPPHSRRREKMRPSCFKWNNRPGYVQILDLVFL